MLSIALSLVVQIEADNTKELNYDDRNTQEEICRSLCLRFRHEEANVDHLVDNDVESHQRHYAFLNHSDSLEFDIVHEAYVILVDEVLEGEEKHREDSNVGNEHREDHGNHPRGQGERHMPSKWELVGVHEGPLPFLTRLLEVVVASGEDLDKLMGSIKEPEAD